MARPSDSSRSAANGGGSFALGGPTKILRFATFELDLAAEELRRSGVLVHLGPQPFRLLALLAGHAGELVRRDAIRDRLWEPGAYIEVNQGINAVVREVRRALGDDAAAPRFIATLRRRGYRFVAPVERVESPDDAGPPGLAGPVSTRIRSSRLLTALLPLVMLGLMCTELPGEGSVATPPAKVPLLTVLPFEYLGPDPDRGLAAGLDAELVTLLARRYPGRVRVPAAGGRARPVSSTLTGCVLSGTMRREGLRIRVSARMTRPDDRSIRWAFLYERQLGSLLRVQIDLASRIAEDLASTESRVPCLDAPVKSQGVGIPRSTDSGKLLG